ncbi:MAG: hypothetical protein OEW87_09900 [Flavobacteriaceae bacterium]|nr:hypothetical protein [Flavobacteriaceae bacterium]
MSIFDDEKKQPSLDSELQDIADNFVEFLQGSQNKQEMMEYIIESFKNKEAQNLERLRAKTQREEEIQANGIVEGHEPGNIGTLLGSELNMNRTEKAFARGVGQTKKHLEHTVEDRVKEVNRLLRGIGGFSSQLKSCFARSTVVFYQQDDPKHSYRERLIFSIHLPKFELQGDWEIEGKTKAPKRPVSSERTDIQATWDDAVNALAKIIEDVGLNAKYCKNDKNYGQFTVRQDLRDQSNLPDEYFSLILDYVTEEKIAETKKAYVKVVNDYDARIAKAKKAIRNIPENPSTKKQQKLLNDHSYLVQEKEFFVGTVPDPGQIDEGLLLYIDVSTSKDYHIVKDKMQTVMTKFILHLSKIALQDAEFDPELKYEAWLMDQGNRPVDGSEFVKDVDTGELFTVKEQDLKPVGKNRKVA